MDFLLVSGLRMLFSWANFAQHPWRSSPIKCEELIGLLYCFVICHHENHLWIWSSVIPPGLVEWYCWWKKSCTSWYVVNPIIYKINVSQVVSRISSIISMDYKGRKGKYLGFSRWKPWPSILGPKDVPNFCRLQDVAAARVADGQHPKCLVKYEVFWDPKKGRFSKGMGKPPGKFHKKNDIYGPIWRIYLDRWKPFWLGWWNILIWADWRKTDATGGFTRRMGSQDLGPKVVFWCWFSTPSFFFSLLKKAM